jgi:predicted ATPase
MRRFLCRHPLQLNRWINSIDAMNLRCIERQIQARANADLEHVAMRERDRLCPQTRRILVPHCEVDQARQNVFVVKSHSAAKLLSPHKNGAEAIRSWHFNALNEKAVTQNNVYMKRFIITGAPGAGKTAIIRQLELDGYGVVEEAATDVIAAAQARGTSEPWSEPSFVDAVADLQRRRLIRASSHPDPVQFHDRSIVCTAALAEYLGYPFSPVLVRELERIKNADIYQRRVFLVRNLGFIKATAARRISFAETLSFERIHEETYRRFDFELVSIEPGPLLKRVHAIKAAIGPTC